MKCVAVLLCLVAAASAVSFFDLVREEWNAFKVSLRVTINLIKILGDHCIRMDNIPYAKTELSNLLCLKNLFLVIVIKIFASHNTH